MRKLKILWLSPKWCSPAFDGARVATEAIISGVPKECVELDYVCVGDLNESPVPSKEMRNLPVSRTYFLQRTQPIGKIKRVFYFGKNSLLSPRRPLTFSSFCSKGLKKYLFELIEEFSYDWVVLDGLHLAAPFMEQGRFRPPPGPKYIYRAHNIECDLWRLSSNNSKNGISRSFFAYQYSSVKNIEKKVIEGVDLAYAISPEDYDWMKKNTSNANLELSLLGVNFSAPFEYFSSNKKQLLFLGRLDWAPNRDGLKWFLDNVWPKLDKKQVELSVAGSGNGQWLSKYKNMPNLKIHGFVDDIDDLYKGSHLTIAPIFYGSGTRIKVVESFAKGRVCLTTRLGAQGSGLIPGEHYLHALSVKEWVEQIEQFQENEAMGMVKSARKKLQNDYDRTIVANKFYERLL